ncbi:N-acyl homoserine lactonase family protein [Streptomyces sp. NPDC046985]|uniref:N-acyl homoserine lactonase family protein n=1 Tax=Streptomyces sp. NPDC046985 TaxID=3155377 RepID=UPI0034083382
MDHAIWRRRLAIILDRDWTEPLPIYTYLIEHDEGLYLVDSGESSRTAIPGWLPWWHPFFQLSVDIHVAPDDEIGPRLRSMGIDPTKDLRHLIMSHLHHDHADGLSHFEGADIVVSEENWGVSHGFRGTLAGALPHDWPSWFAPNRIAFTGPPAGPFAHTYPVTEDGKIFCVPTPGHMPGHMSVVVRNDSTTYFLAGDATYDADLLEKRIVDGISGNLAVSLHTLDSIAAFGRGEPTVLLPAHDPFAEQRLAERITLSE